MARRDALGKPFKKTNTAQSLPKQAKIVLSAIEQLAESIVIKVMLDVTANLRRAAPEGGTPVKTGWARANWQIGIKTPITEVPGNPDNVGPAEGKQSAGQATLLTYKLRSGPVWISNNVPYIQSLNEGTSRQAPAGFVQAAIQEAVNGIK